MLLHILAFKCIVNSQKSSDIFVSHLGIVIFIFVFNFRIIENKIDMASNKETKEQEDMSKNDEPSNVEDSILSSVESEGVNYVFDVEVYFKNMFKQNSHPGVFFKKGFL